MNHQTINPYYHPLRIATVVQVHIGHCKNLALILDKYVERRAIDENKEKGPWVRDLLKGQIIDIELARRAYQRWRFMLESLDVVLFDAELEWRMVVGLGGESVLETDITLHHLYGLPIIPGSALKGLTRAYVTGEEKNYFVPIEKPEAERKPSLDEKTDHPDIQRIFGAQERSGSVIFFDALPLNGQATLVIDIMNPHYPKYYDTLKSDAITPPADNQSPNPIPFLAVKEDTVFTFALAPRDPNDPQHKTDAALAVRWLQKALQKYGAGGKTSAGYGYFKELRNQESSTKSALQEVGQKVMQPESESTSYERPRIPHFHTGQDMRGEVVSPTDELRQLAPEATAFLRYESFSLHEVLIIVSAEDAQAWLPGNTRNCSFVREEVRNGCTILVCQPRAGKKKKDR